jgi:hypothetical protein
LLRTITTGGEQVRRTRSEKECCTGKHRDLVDVVEFTVAFTVECGPQVCDEDLRALEEAHFFALECAFVTEACELFGQQIDECCC